VTWPTKPLGEIATIERVGVAPGSLPGDTPYLGLEHIERGGRILGRQTVAEAQLASTKFVFDKGHVLFGKLRPNLGKVARPDFSGVCSTDILPIRPGKMLDRAYLHHYLAQPSMVELAASRTSGANLPRLSPTVLAAFEVPLPPLTEQRRITAILDQADALRAKRRQVLAHLEDLTRSIFLAMFSPYRGQVRTVQEIAVAEMGSIRTGPFGSQLLHSEFVDEGIAVLGIDNVVANSFRWSQRRFISPEKYESLKRYTVIPDDVLITIMGTCGRCVVVPDDIPTAINTKHLCAISVDRTKVVPEFVRASFLWHPDTRRFLVRRAKGSIMAGLNMGIIKEMPLPVPPMDQQTAFVGRLRDARDQLSLSESSALQFEMLLQTLQSRAFAGSL